MLYLSVGFAFAVSVSGGPCKCSRENDRIPEKDELHDSDWGKYCDDWDAGYADECKKGGESPGWCDRAWCYVDEGCDDAKKSVQFKGSGLYWSYGACAGDHNVCMAYSKPRPKIRPCPEKDSRDGDSSSSDEGSGNGACKRRNSKKKCARSDVCKWANDQCVADNDSSSSDEGASSCSESKPSAPVVSNNVPWGGTQSPDYWFNCVSRWCSKYTWMGGADQCHYETKYGCGCEAMEYEDCMKSTEDGEFDCCWAGKKTGCQEIIECPRLTFQECLEHSDKCAPCGGGGCSYKCQMGPGQKIPGFQSLVLDANCNCKVTQMF